MHSFSIGFALNLATACDIRLCSQDAVFTIKEVDLGMCADLGVIQRFMKIVGNDSWFRELAYTGRVFKADEALAHGFVSHVYENHAQLLKATYELAENIASKSPVAIYTLKKSVLYSRDHSV